MLCLTLRHPWPWAICVLGKDIENRNWHPGRRLPPGSWFAIHGGKWPSNEVELADLRDVAGGLAIDHRDRLPGGDATLLDVLRYTGVVAVCRLGAVVTASASSWFEGPYGWQLAATVVLPEPVPCRGQQGLWGLPDDVLAEVRRQFKAAREGVIHA
jgi:hypothetical protein